MFGGMHSRFWMLRKHFNSISVEELEQAPFYSWETISLQLPHRDVDLVIQDPKHMSYFLKFIIYEINTINGRRNSALNILKILNSKQISEYR